MGWATLIVVAEEPPRFSEKYEPKRVRIDRGTHFDDMEILFDRRNTPELRVGLGG
jgi:hypothetical protein